MTATGLLARGYAAICEHLKQSYEVVPLPYDWRQPLGEAAEALGRAIDKMLDATERANLPIRILAHSMGGLVVRAPAIERWMTSTPAQNRTV